MRRLTPIVIATLATVALASGRAVAQGGAAGGAAAAKPGAATQLKWGPAPPGLPAGAKLAVVDGDPGKPGPFTVRLLVPSGYRIAPHSHPTEETLTVVRGAFHYGMGDSWNSATMKTLTRGKSETMKAGQNHYARASGRTELEIKSTGPFEINYVKASDDPRNKKTKPKV